MFTVRLVELVDSYVESTVKFVYVHWIGESVPFAKRGKFGVVHGSVEQHFQVREELQTLIEFYIMQKLMLKQLNPTNFIQATTIYNISQYSI